MGAAQTKLQGKSMDLFASLQLNKLILSEKSESLHNFLCIYLTKIY